MKTYATIFLGIALLFLAFGCITTTTPDGTTTVAPADGVIAALQVAIQEAFDAYTLAETEGERKQISARLQRLRLELQAWQAWTK